MNTVVSNLRDILTSKAMIAACGGALGTYARYRLDLWLSEASWRSHASWLSSFPVGTFVINVSGAFVLGLVGTVFIARLPEHQAWFLFLGTGFCGGYTTFSTFEWETLKLLRDGSWVLAAVNVLGSVVIGFIGVVLGAVVGKLAFVGR
jgi:CrcB protein